MKTITIITLIFSLFAELCLAQGLQSARPWMGVGIEKGKDGVVVTKVLPGTPAEKAGLQVNDEILQVNQIKITNPKKLVETIGAMGVGYTVDVVYRRNSSKLSLKLKLVARPEMDEMLRRNLLGKKAPEFDLPVLFGETGSLKKLAGKPILLNFWATWCPACKSALPALERHALAIEKKGYKVVLISTENKKVVQSFMNQWFKGRKVPFVVLVDPKGEVSGKYSVSALPTFVVLNDKAQVSFAAIGAGRILDQAISQM